MEKINKKMTDYRPNSSDSDSCASMNLNMVVLKYSSSIGLIIHYYRDCATILLLLYSRKYK